MTLPTNIVFPQFTRFSQDLDPKELKSYLGELLFSLQQMYEQLAEGVNGTIRADWAVGNTQWTPVLKDVTNTGTTFTYDHQSGWVWRQGLFTHVWCDVEWTANTGTIGGNMYVELPYKVANTNDIPFVGVCQPSGITFTGGTDCVVQGINNTYRAEVWNTGDAFTTANQATVASGRVIFYLMYLGKQDEQN